MDTHDGDKSLFAISAMCPKIQLVTHTEQNVLLSERLVGEVGYRAVTGGKAAWASR
jgi:hypothetical protein